MKKLPVLLNTPARAVIAVGMLTIVAELLIMMVVENVFPLSMHKFLYLFDPILLIAIVSPALFLLIFKPMRAQQAGLERQLDELRRFQRLSIGRELRMKELVKEIDALRSPLSVEPAGDIPVTDGSPEAPRHSAEQPATIPPTEESQRNALLFMLEDLEAGRKKIEQAHREWMSALDRVDDPIFLHDREFRILRCNKAYQQCAGIPFHELIGRPYYEVFPKNHAPMPCCLRAMNKAEEEEEEEMAVGGVIYRSRAFSIHDEQGAYLYSMHTLEDITERKQADKSLARTKSELEEAQHLSHIGSWYWDAQTDATTGTDELLHIYGLDPATQPMPAFREQKGRLYPVESWERINAAVLKTLQTGVGYKLDVKALRSDGAAIWVTTRSEVVRDAEGQIVGLRGTVQDITERKQAEAAIEHANRALATLSEVNRGLVYATEENELLQAICQAIVKQRGYRMAWVGYKQHDENKSIKIMAHAGHDEGFLDAMQLTWADTERGMGPSGRAIRSGTTQLCQDMINDPSYLPWCAAASQRGYASDIALPLTRESGDVFGILHVYSGEMNAFTPAEIALLEEMARDLAFGVRSLNTRHERDLALEQNWRQLAQLQDNLEDTVRAIAGIVEMRDPYTAGHQARVADLAAAIARQMGLPEEQVHGIHLAGVVHDLGKILVPAEILSKPGKISDIERSLIKVHPQAGYDILQGIDFTWPVAQMVLQHHERLDGSGYPQGLKGDAILLEARILSVADVVEAMSSHRPYRPGLGIEVALEEITKQRGIHFDPQAVDACLALFREQGYSFKIDVT